MTRLFRSISCGVMGRTQFNPPTPCPVFQDVKKEDDEEMEEQKEEEEEEEDEEEYESEDDESSNPVSTPFINPITKSGGAESRARQNQNQSAILDMLMAVLRKSLVTCSVEREDVSSLDISWPTEVHHVSHVTFDRFNGFLGLPTELEPEVPRRVPSASERSGKKNYAEGVRVFGVSAKSMQCSYDYRGNSVPTILLMMQKRLYSEGGLKAEGIFRINPENGQEEFVRDQLNRGVVPYGIDVHCLSGLIKAWFRELPTGVLDSLTPEQVMRCNTEDDCTKLEELLPPTEAALLDWAINLMADVVEHERYNKMNARNIAMVFAPNMTQMADPLTALIHAVQVMNFLKTLILKTLREREESAAHERMIYSSSCKDYPIPLHFNSKEFMEQTVDVISAKKSAPISELLGIEEKLRTPEEKGNNAEDGEFVSVPGGSTPCRYETGGIENRYRSKYDSEHWLRLRKGVRKLCRHPVFQLTKFKKSASTVGVVNTRAKGGEAWA